MNPYDLQALMIARRNEILQEATRTRTVKKTDRRDRRGGTPLVRDALIRLFRRWIGGTSEPWVVGRRRST